MVDVYWVIYLVHLARDLLSVVSPRSRNSRCRAHDSRTCESFEWRGCSLKITRIAAAIAFVSLLTYGNARAQQQCTTCDCKHFPVPESCEKCCGVATGTITAVKSNTVTIEETTRTSGSVKVTKTFAITPATKKNSDLKEGAPATIFFRKSGDMATRVDLVNELGNLLVPANEPDPPLPPSCRRVPTDALKVFLGSNLGLTTSDEVKVLTLGNTDVLSLRRTSKGLAVNAKTFSEDGKIIAEVIDSRFYINRNNAFRIDTDKHSLRVYDQQDQKVLDVRYINPHSVKVLGIFRASGFGPVVVDENQMSFGGSELAGGCFSGATLFKFGP
jgi:hypothetical protein